jgi:hypothetical protein
MAHVDAIVAPIVFDINADMTSEQVIKEMHTKTASSVHPSKLIMQAFIMIAMTYETVCSTARAAAEAVGHAHVPHTLPRVENPIDSGIVLSIRIDNLRKLQVFINKTFPTESLINQLLIKRACLSISIDSR